MLTPERGARRWGPILVLASSACAGGAPRAAPAPAERAPALEPYVLLVGTAQDGGLPQIGCERACCRAAREDPERARLVASALVVEPASGRRWLLDATPDLARQLELARGHGAPHGPGGRPALFDGIFLTHAHAGHYTGLVQLGREAYGSAPQAVFASPSLVSYLRANEPWALLERLGHVRYEALELGAPRALTDSIAIEAIPVPHRGELSDTVAYLVRGPRRALLYLPDIDAWEPWERSIEELVASVDVALLDGTFFDAGELAGRDPSLVPHPRIADSIERFAKLSDGERAKIRFFHLNHTNPAADPASQAAQRVRAAGMQIAGEGERFEL